MKKLFTTILVVLIPLFTFSQGIDSVFVEKTMVPGSISTGLTGTVYTYKIFVDMAPGYKFNLVYGNVNHPAFINTSGTFFNDAVIGSTTANALNPALFSFFPSAEYDSWVSVGGLADGRIALANDESGPWTSGTPIVPTLVGLNLTMLDKTSSTTDFTITGGSWAALVAGGVGNYSPLNRILIAQITTNGELSFELNLQLFNPQGNAVKYVAKNPTGVEVKYSGLIYPKVSGCTNPLACNYNPAAVDDDGSCIVPVSNCSECNSNNTGLDIIDSDGDGICNADEIAGCTSTTACNYNALATDDNGSCIEPVSNCSECNAANTGLDLIDDDGDGVCNAEEIEGCTSSTACNYNPLATDDNGSCLEPVENCTVCNGTVLVKIDYDKDGICNEDDPTGCTNPLACNYNPAATTDDGSCLVPVENCSACDSIELIIVDADGDGICNADEDKGCTNPAACNYNAAALTDDGSCIVPVDHCSECNETNNGLVIIDTDKDGICDANEVAGCTSSTACNYDALATDDDNSCLEPVSNCSICDGDTLKLIDSDMDGICDANEIRGCTNPLACNYDVNASDDDGSCLVPVYECSSCEGENLVKIDSDNDGVCDANEVWGCTNPIACNYNPLATENSGQCILPVENCSVCEDGKLVQLDLNNNGVPDCDEPRPGCTNSKACNFNPLANTDDGTCIVPVENCSECNETNDGLIIFDEDGDGVCDANEPGLEDILVETYYISEANDSTDTDGGHLPEGSVTYRIFADLGTGYKLSTVYGNSNHELFFETSTQFFNNFDRGEQIGSMINDTKLKNNTVALDSWLTIGSATRSHFGIPKALDTDGSIVGGLNNDGGSADIEGGLLVNNPEQAGIPLTMADGLIPGEAVTVTVIGADISMFGKLNSGTRMSTQNGAWSSLNALLGSTKENIVLLAQITTDGILSFELNIQVIKPGSEGIPVRYVARNPVGNEIEFSGLIYQSVPGCTNAAACNFNSLANIDNGTCLVPVENCSKCENGSLVIIDSDGDGICDEDESNGLEWEASQFIFNIYPNPSVNDIFIEMNTVTSKRIQYSLMITDISGKILLESEISTNSGSFKEWLNVESFEEGLYLLKVVSDDGKMISRRFSKL